MVMSSLQNLKYGQSDLYRKHLSEVLGMWLLLSLLLPNMTHVAKRARLSVLSLSTTIASCVHFNLNALDLTLLHTRWDCDVYLIDYHKN